MTRLHLAATLVALGLGGVALAHPVGEPFETRGECEAAFAESSKDDREALFDRGIFTSRGAAQRTFNDLFACAYDEEEEAWFIIRIAV